LSEVMSVCPSAVLNTAISATSTANRVNGDPPLDPDDESAEVGRSCVGIGGGEHSIDPVIHRGGRCAGGKREDMLMPHSPGVDAEVLGSASSHAEPTPACQFPPRTWARVRPVPVDPSNRKPLFAFNVRQRIATDLAPLMAPNSVVAFDQRSLPPSKRITLRGAPSAAITGR
jgi:hypothetical protein